MRRYTLELNDELYDQFEKTAKITKSSKKETFKRALSLFILAINEQKSGSVLEFVNKKENYRKEVITFL